MLSRRYLQRSVLTCFVLFTLVRVRADFVEDVSLLFAHLNYNGSEVGATLNGYSSDSSSDEIDGGTMATPVLPLSILPSATVAEGERSDEKSTVTITPSATETVPAMVITASKVTLGHRLGVEKESDNGTESFSAQLDDISLTASSGLDREEDDSKGRHSRYQRFPDEEVADTNFTSGDVADGGAAEYYGELTGEGSYADNYLEEDNPEHLPNPMALINPNGEGSNPPLEEDFAEAFKKGNPNGKRRRFRGGRKNRMRLKKVDQTSAQTSGADSNQSGQNSQDQSSQVTPSPLLARDRDPTKFIRIRSTTSPPTFYTRASTTTTEAPSTTESIPPPQPPQPSPPTPSPDESESQASPAPIIKNGPKPIILQSTFHSEPVGVTQSPQIEKPSGNTEKISTYFFSTPAPSNRLRLRQKIRDSAPQISSTTTTEVAPIEDDDMWKNEFKDFHKTSFFSGPVASGKFKIPEFLPMDIGLESDKQESVENSLSRPDTHENKAYSIIRHNTDASSHREFEISTAPKPRKPKKPAATIYYDQPHSSSSPETETYAQGSSSEPSAYFPTHRPTSGSHYDRTKDKVIFYNDNPYSAHHGVTTTAILGEFSSSPESPHSQTVGTHISFSENPNHDSSSTTDHYDHNRLSMYPRGRVYPDDSNPHGENTFKNGPPDSSHIHSPNMVDTQLSPFSEGPHNNPYAHSYVDAHPTNQSPGSMYGTVEEVPAHDNPYGNHPHHHVHHQVPYPFSSEGPGGPSLSPYPHSFPPSSPMSPPPPQPSHLPPHQDMPTFSPSPYDIQAQHESSRESPFPHSNNHLAESPTQVIHSESSPHHHSSEIHHNSLESLSPSPSSPPEGPDSPSPLLQDVPSGVDHGSHLFEGHENDFPPHAHTMSHLADYEPANPPLPHDHPFHSTFIPFPSHELGEAGPPQEHHDHDSNSLSSTGGPYHPGTVENVPTGRPPFEPSPLIPASKPQAPHGIEFTPIPDDVKENELYNVYAKPQEDSPPTQSLHELQQQRHPYLQGLPARDHYDHQHHPQHTNEHAGYMGPPPTQGNPPLSYHPSGPSGPEHAKDIGYTGPVAEIHPGVYPHPENHGESYQHHDQSNPNYPHHEGGNFKPSQLDLETLKQHDHPHEGGLLGPSNLAANDIKSKLPQPSFSNTPYVLMFPQLIPEAAMRPSPPSLLSKEIPVIQASSISDFASASSGEKPPLAPGFQTVPVHPRDQMYQVLAKAHYDKQMDKYMESKKRPPSAIYTPYGILVPVGTSVDPASSMSHNIFSKRPPPRRGEKSLLGALLGSSSGLNGRFQPPNMGHKLNKLMEFEPAIDLLAEKLAMKLVTAHHALNDKKVEGLGHGLIKKMDQVSDDFGTHLNQMGRPQSFGHGPPPPRAGELKDYLKGVLKGHFTQVVDKGPISLDESRRPMSLANKLLNTIFRKGRFNFPPPKSFLPIGSGSMMPTMGSYTPSSSQAPHIMSNNMHHSQYHVQSGPPSPGSIISSGVGHMMSSLIGGNVMSHPSHMIPNVGTGTIMTNMGGMMTSASMVMPNKVLPPPALSNPTPQPSHHPSHYHGGIGHPFPPLFPQGAQGFLGSIKRFFNFGQPERSAFEVSNFGGRNLFGNGSFSEAPSPRFNQKQQPSMNMIHHSQVYPVMMASTVQRKTISVTPPPPPPPPPYQPPQPSILRPVSDNSSSIFSSIRNSFAAPQSKLAKKNKSNKGKKNEVKLQNRLISSSQSIHPTPLPQLASSTTSKPKITNPSTSNNKHFTAVPNSTLSKPHTVLSKPSGSKILPSPKDKPQSISKGKNELESVKKELLKKRKGGDESNSSTTTPPPSKKMSKLDMFQTLLGSTRSVLNYFKSEARKNAPTVLKPRTAIADNEQSNS